MILIFLFSLNVFAQNNNFDLWSQKVLKWEDTEKADRISDYLRNGLLASPFIFSLLEDQNRWKKTGQTAATLGVNFLSTQIVKHLTKRERPDGSNNLSFYSGHASTAMASATLSCFFVDQKTCLVLNLAAVTTGYLRIAANRHWMTDVIYGLGFGYAHGHFIPTMVFKW